MKQKPEIRDRIKELRRVCATELVPAPVNWRTHSAKQKTALASVLEEIGIADAVLARELPDGRLQLIDGHLRRETLGESLLPVLVLDVSEREAAILLATIDPLAAMAGTDAEKLDAILREAVATTEGVQELLAEIADDAGLYRDDEKEIVEDEAPEPPTEPITRPGDLWILGDHRLLCGDSTKAEDVERLMAGAKADLCFTSPPYNLGKSVHLRNGARSGASSAYNENADNNADAWCVMMKNFIELAMVYCEVVAVNVQLLSGNKRHLLTLFGTFATHTIDVAVWVKSNPQPAMEPKVMNSAFELIWILTKSKNPKRTLPTASFDRGTFSNAITSGTAKGHDAAVHGAVFPLPVAAKFVGGISHPNSIIYEPFCGSGTTLIAAEQLGRRCYGLEISPAYCDVIVARWEKLTGRKATLERSPHPPEHTK